MVSESAYFSIVVDRIEELRNELLQVQNKLQGLNRSSKSRKRYDLEKEFILRKISYLEKLINLPLFMFINNLSELEMSQIQETSNTSISKSSLIQLFGLTEISRNFGKHKLMTLAYIKDSFIDDFDFMTTLLFLHKSNFDLSNRKIDLCSNNVFGFQSFKEISDLESKLNRSSKALETNIDEIKCDYDIDSLKEIHEYVKNPNKHLTEEFISKHSSKSARKPSKFSGFVRNIFSLKRGKKEEAFLSDVIEAYKNDKKIRDLGLNSIDFNTVTKSSLKETSKRVRKQVLLKQREILEKGKEISESKKRTLREFQRCDAKKKSLFQVFTKMLHSKCSYVPKIFEDQMWNEPDLKESLMREACYLEEKDLIEKISGQLNSENTYVNVETIKFDLQNAAVKRLVA